MNLFRFVFHSYIFRRIVLCTISFVLVLWILNISFDRIWKYGTMLPIGNVEYLYQIPKSYDNISRVNIKLIDKDKAAIECNRKFRIFKNSFYYYDTLYIEKPDSVNPATTKIFLTYENPGPTDSIYLVLSKSDKPGIFWNQIFYSSVIISSLNDFSRDPQKFRIQDDQLVSKQLLADNDSLIEESIKYFNVNSNNLGLADCGANSSIFKSICDRYGLPCRIVTLQGGDALNDGYNDHLGYPLHQVCEVYTSKYKKWIVIDPYYGSIFRLESEPLNAVEISNRVSFMNAKDILQDSVMVTRKTVVGNDYFKYYENVYFFTDLNPDFAMAKILNIFYDNLYYVFSHYSNSQSFYKSGINYVVLKTVALFIIASIYFYIILFFIIKRLLLAKWKR